MIIGEHGTEYDEGNVEDVFILVQCSSKIYLVWLVENENKNQCICHNEEYMRTMKNLKSILRIFSQYEMKYRRNR